MISASGSYDVVILGSGIAGLAAALAGQDVDVVNLGHVRRMTVYRAVVSDGCHMMRSASPDLGILSLHMSS